MAADHLDGTRLGECPPDRATRDKCSRPPEVLLAPRSKTVRGRQQEGTRIASVAVFEWAGALALRNQAGGPGRDYRSIKLCTGSLPPSV
jgi:hypothetical protein